MSQMEKIHEQGGGRSDNRDRVIGIARWLQHQLIWLMGEGPQLLAKYEEERKLQAGAGGEDSNDDDDDDANEDTEGNYDIELFLDEDDVVDDNIATI